MLIQCGYSNVPTIVSVLVLHLFQLSAKHILGTLEIHGHKYSQKYAWSAKIFLMIVVSSYPCKVYCSIDKGGWILH